MYKSVSINDTLGKSTFNKNYLTRASLILSRKEPKSILTVLTTSLNEDEGWKAINKRLAAAISKQPNNENAVTLLTLQLTALKKFHVDNVADNLNEFLNMLYNLGASLRVTSGYRLGAVMKNGKPSPHASGRAVDIVPENGNYEEIDFIIANNPEVQDFMIKNNIGVFPEITEEVMKQTGASGPHYHFVLYEQNNKGYRGLNYLNSIKHLIKQPQA